jgi:hypothetical protein
VGLELSLLSTIEELLGRNISGSGLENRDYGRRNLSRWPLGTLYSQKLALTSPTSGGLLVGIVHSQIKATELFRYYFTMFLKYFRLKIYLQSKQKCSM